MSDALAYYRSLSRGARRELGLREDFSFEQRTLQMPLSHYTDAEVEYFDLSGNPVHIDVMFNVKLDMFVPYIAKADGEAFVVPELGDLYPPERPFDKSTVSRLDMWLGPPKHRNARFRAFRHALPKAVDHQYWMAEELNVYGFKEFKLIETGVVLEGLMKKLMWDVFVPRYKDEGFWGAASIAEEGAGCAAEEMVKYEPGRE